MSRLPYALPLLLALAGCASTPSAPPAADAIDLQRFMGTWYVIANIPYWAENGKVATRDVYRLREDGRIDNDFVFRRGFDAPEKRWNGVSTVVPGSKGAEWKVSFIWPLSTRLQVLEVDPDYGWALLATPDRSKAWLFDREPDLDAATYAERVQRFAAYGVDPNALRRVPQRPDQVGAPGFQ